jgi:hypothetical protein
MWTYRHDRPAIIQHVKPRTYKGRPLSGDDFGEGGCHRAVFDEGSYTTGGIRIARHAGRKGTSAKYLTVRYKSVAASGGRVRNPLIESPRTAIDRYIESKALPVSRLRNTWNSR